MGFPVNELTSALWRATLKDQDGTAVPGSTLTDLRLTLYEKTSGTILNNRDNQNVLNQNQVTVDESGLITWQIMPADNAIVTTKKLEIHVAVLTASWSSGTRKMVHQFEIDVTNINKVP
jgi:hypothetical protein